MRLSEVQARLRLAFHPSPDAIVVLSGGIVYRPKKDIEYQSTTYRDVQYTNTGEMIGVLAGKARVIAAAHLADRLPNIPIITTSKESSFDYPTHAKVIEHELTARRFRVDQKRIIKEETSLSTQAQLRELVKLAVSQHVRHREWKRFFCIANDYQLPRLREMYARLAILPESLQDKDFQLAWRQFHTLGMRLVFIAAEDVLRLRSRHYDSLIDIVHHDASYYARIKAEKRGVEALRRNTYRQVGKNFS